MLGCVVDVVVVVVVTWGNRAISVATISSDSVLIIASLKIYGKNKERNNQ